VEVKVTDGNVVTVKGPKGTLTQTLDRRMTIEVEDNVVKVSRPDDEQFSRSLHGLTRSLINNMVLGVTEEYSKSLEINGVGYRAAKEGNNLVMNLGYSHQVIVPDTADVRTEVPNPNQVVVKGMDKQKVGQFAADVRAKRPPEPYKGKGIKYVDEHIIRKEGKTGAK
jgi:ribosomal protein L6, bacterial type